MSQSGSVVEVLVQDRGSQLVGDHLSGATTVLVQDPTPFDTAGGQVYIDGNAYAYTSVVEVPDPTDATDVNAQLLLSSGLLAAESDLTPVGVWSGSQVLSDLVLLVATGEEADPAVPITVTSDQRVFWEGRLGPVDPPVSVVVSNDLTELEDAPGWTPTLNGAQLVGLPDPTEVAVDPPEASPAIRAVVGNASGLTVYVEPFLPTTLVDYLVNGVVVAADQRTQVINLTTDGTNPMALLTDYAITTQAHNSAGTAAPSVGVTAQLNPGVTPEMVVAILAAGAVITGSVQVGATLLTPTGSTLVGQAILDALIANGNVTINGLTNFLNGSLTLGTGVSDPTSKPGVTSAGYDYVEDAFSSTVQRGAFDNGTSLIFTAGVLYSGSAWSIDKTTGVRSLLANFPTDFNGLGGVVKIGTNWYALGMDGSRSGGWYVYIFNSSWVKTGEWRLTDTGLNPIPVDHWCALGVDGAGALLIARRSTSNAFTINGYSLAGVPSAAAGTYPTWAGAIITGVVKAPVDTGTARYIVTSLNQGTRVFNTSTAARITGEEWPIAGSGANVTGISHDGTVFRTTQKDPADNNAHLRIWTYTNLIGTYDFAFTWVDNDAGGTGTAETRRSAIRTVAPTKRAKWTVSLPSAPPDDGTTDGANTANLYAVTTGGTLVIQTNLVEGTYSTTYSTLATSGAAPPSTSGFAARIGAIGRVSSAAVDGSSNPLVDFLGDGKYRLNGAPQDEVALTAVTPASGFAFSSGTFAYQVRNGFVTVFANFTATTGTPFTSATEVTAAAAGAIPAAYRPSVPVCSGARVGGFAQGFMSVQSDGSITVRNDTGAARNSLRSTVSYPKP